MILNFGLTLKPSGLLIQEPSSHPVLTRGIEISSGECLRPVQGREGDPGHPVSVQLDLSGNDADGEQGRAEDLVCAGSSISKLLPAPRKSHIEKVPKALLW